MGGSSNNAVLTRRRRPIKILAKLIHLKLPGFDNEDKIVKYWSANTVCLLLYIILLYGCASQISLEDLSREWIARPLSELQQEMKKPDSYASKIGWKETTYPLANRNFVYIEPVKADCFVHWEVNEGGMIIGYQAKGNGCSQRGPDSITDIQIRSE
jgi:hypothetical protein